MEGEAVHHTHIVLFGFPLVSVDRCLNVVKEQNRLRLDLITSVCIVLVVQRNSGDSFINTSLQTSKEVVLIFALMPNLQEVTQFLTAC